MMMPTANATHCRVQFSCWKPVVCVSMLLYSCKNSYSEQKQNYCMVNIPCGASKPHWLGSTLQKTHVPNSQVQCGIEGQCNGRCMEARLSELPPYLSHTYLKKCCSKKIFLSNNGSIGRYSKSPFIGRYSKSLFISITSFSLFLSPIQMYHSTAIINIQ